MYDLETPIVQEEINMDDLNEWLEANTKHMEEVSVEMPACWYDGTDGTCSA